MLQVFFLILKIIGIILAAVIGLVLLLLLLVLFVPVRYRACCIKNTEKCRAEAKISWLLHLVSIPVSYREGKLQGSIKIFGFPVMKLFEEEKAWEGGTQKERKREDRKEVSEILNEPEKAVNTENTENIEKQEDEPEREPEREPEGEGALESKDGAEADSQEEESGLFAALGDFFRLLWRTVRKIIQSLKNLKCTFRRFCDKIKRMVRKYREMKAFAEDERTKAALRLVWSQAGILARHALPRRMKGEVHFGTEDPALTGQILGALGIFYPLFMDNVKVNPDFEQAVLEGELSVKGRLRAAAFVRTAWRLFRDKNVRYVYRRLNRT